MTQAQRKALEWFAEQSGPVYFGPSPTPLDVPREHVRERLEALGFIQRLPDEPLKFAKYQITASGRAALKWKV